MIAILGSFFVLAVDLWRWLILAGDEADPVHSAGTLSISCKAPKPDWVREEVIRMKTLMPDAGCRSIELIFNRRFARTHGVTVGKTYVARVLSAHRYAARARERGAGRSRPRSWPHNTRWGMDLTAIRGKDGRRYWIVGIIEYRSRALLVLAALVRKTAAAIERVLAEAFRRFGPPRSLVTDDEGPFRSRTWKRLLARFRVLHRRIEPYCPWQNGRIERFFGTLKRKIGQRRAASSAELQSDLNVFRCWYNHIRPHQALESAIRCGARTLRLSLTPAEAWRQWDDCKHGSRFEGWGGLLRGWACRI